MSKIIVYIPVKNDAWCIEKSIKHAVLWADEVIVADECSIDGSIKIYKELDKKYNNLTIIYNRPKFDFTTSEPRNYMLEQVRKFDGNNLIFEIHADEIMSAEILKPKIKNKLINDMPVGAALMLPWITLWKHPLFYRDDRSVWSNNRCWFAFRDDRKAQFTSAYFHGPRAPDRFLNNIVNIDYLKVLHYQFVNMDIERSKQALYQIFEKNHYPDKNIEYINKTYACAFDERDIKVSRIDENHIKPWIKKGINIDEEYSSYAYNWRDSEVLKNFLREGVEKYMGLNIWYIDWEDKRKKAINLGIDNIPKEIIIDPRDWSTKKAHMFLMKYQMYPFWKIDFYKLLVVKAIENIKRKINSD
ncbi:hypothetical protein HOK00_08255 [bacterium]|jgi:hypothetical protein|nr:hypothetical protein [bacterium]